MKRRKAKRKGLTFKQWLDAMPPVKGGRAKQTCSLELTLTVSNWMLLRETAVRHGATMEETASYVLSQSDTLCELSMQGK